MKFERLNAFSVDFSIITNDMTECIKTDLILERIGEFVRTTVFPKMLEFDFTKLTYVFTPLLSERVTCQCLYTAYDFGVFLEIGIAHAAAITLKQNIDEFKEKSKELFDSLEKEFVEYCKENTDIDEDTEINKFLKEENKNGN